MALDSLDVDRVLLFFKGLLVFWGYGWPEGIADDVLYRIIRVPYTVFGVETTFKWVLGSLVSFELLFLATRTL